MEEVDFKAIFKEFGETPQGQFGEDGSYDPWANYDPYEDPEFVDEDEEFKDIFRQIINYGKEGSGPNEFPVEMPFCSEEMGPPNPFWDKMGTLLDSGEELRQMATEIKNIGDKNLSGGVFGDEYNFKEIMEQVEHLRPQFEAIVKRIDDTPLTPGVMPQRPPPKTLYGRVDSSAELYDVGAGSGAKLRRHLAGTGIEIKGCDPGSGCSEIDRCTFSTAVKESRVPEGATVTTFNSATQLTEEEEQMLSEFDGIHVFPDMTELQKIGVAKAEPEGLYRCGDQRGRVWLDRQCKLDGQVKVKEGYAGANTYKKRNITLKTRKSNIKGSGFDTHTRPGTFVGDPDLGHKFDGEMLRIDSTDGQVVVQNRAGEVEVGQADDKTKFSLLCEKVKDETGTVVGLVLIRILLWGSMVPFHGGPALRAFTRRVRLKWNGKPLLPPPPYDPRDLTHKTRRFVRVGSKLIPVDGRIRRTQQMDYYDKFTWTVDLRKDKTIPALLEREFNIPVVFEWGEVTDQLYEYDIEVASDLISIRNPRPRLDKTQANTKAQITETVRRALELCE